MADIYVDSNAVGANNGTSAANAYTSFSSVTGAAAGDRILVSYLHQNTLGGATTYTFSNGLATNPIKIYSVDFANGNALRTGALLTNTGFITINGNLYVYGMTFRVTSASVAISLGAASTSRANYESCTFSLNNAGSIGLAGTAASSMRFLNCHFNMASSTAATSIISATVGTSTVEFLGCTITFRAAGHTTAFSCVAKSWIMECCDMTGGSVTNLFSGNTASGNAILLRCKLPTYTNLIAAIPATSATTMSIWLDSCAAGTTSTPPMSLTAYQTYPGLIESTLLSYRTGGADDGEQSTPYAWKMTSNANGLNLINGLYSIVNPVAYVEKNVPITLTLYLASSSTLTNEEFAVELLGPSDAGTPTAQGYRTISRAALISTPSPLATDTSVWVGAGVTNVYKVQFSYTPTLNGYVELRPVLYKPSTVVYVDPYVYVS